jgi:DNA-binding XRE family transcriptional regulator
MQILDEVRAARRLPGPAVRREIRRNAGLSQQRLADELGVHWQTVHRWETGRAEPSMPVRARYARLLADLNELVTS